LARVEYYKKILGKENKKDKKSKKEKKKKHKHKHKKRKESTFLKFPHPLTC
jgi:hypothetical protein